MAVPNFSEGRAELTIAALARALTAASGARLLDIHSDADHNRSVYTLAGTAAQLSEALVDGAGAAIKHINISTHKGAHPCVGALDVAPLVYTDERDRGRAAAAALVTADRIAHEHQIPVFLYGILTAGTVTRAAVRQGGPSSLASRIAASDATPDFGPHALHPRAGATLVAARPPLIAFNLEIDGSLEDAQRIAAKIRGGGIRALGIQLHNAVQVSTNIEDQTPLKDVVAAVQAHARVIDTELVGLAPARVFEDFPQNIGIRNRRSIEEALPS